MLLYWLLAIFLKLNIAFSDVPHNRVLRQAGSSGQTCKTPHNDVGTCINIKTCQSLFNLVISSGRDPQVGTYLRQSQCGYDNSTPRVCCPKNAPKFGSASTVGDSWTTRPTGTVTRPTGTVTRPTGTTTLRDNGGDSTNWAECGKSNKKDTRIVGGKNATKGEWPWMVALGYRTPTKPGPDFKCGASLISNRYVVTAAHCVSGLTGGLEVSVARLGDLDLNNDVYDEVTPFDAPVAEVTIHPQYSTNPMQNDIALIRLQNTVQFTEFIRPICLLSGPEYRRNDFYNRKRPFIIGWGALEWRGATTTRLQETTINIIENTRCAEMYKSQRTALINEKILCAGEPGKDTCQGDSGGPLIFPNATEIRFYLGGIVSYGIRCATPEYPGVYTRVSEFVDWINQVTGESF